MVDLEGETLTFVRNPASADRDGINVETDAAPLHPVSIDEIFTPHDFGSWPEGFRVSREALYGDEGR